MTRRALIIGLNQYDTLKALTGCVNDAQLLEKVLSRHEDESLNYECRLFTSPGEGASPPTITRTLLRDELKSLLAPGADAALFYFAGHGCITDFGGFVMTQEASKDEPGISMDDLLALANKSGGPGEILLILDCCHSGVLGNPESIQSDIAGKALLREGVTILAASRPEQTAAELGGHGMFTSMVLHALHGGAADVMGNVSSAGIYALVDQALGAWDQRPIYKTHASRMSPVRRCTPAVGPGLLRILPELFPDPMDNLRLDPSYERTSATVDPKHVAIFDNLVRFRDARLVRMVDEDHLYFVAMNSGCVRLTGLGRSYWYLAKNGRI